ncbi:MAG TPA: autotransporter outer membrane beta-barrel domain-containing protein [Epsilonproteobacteria bacterium]|nr:autotransporter outer membrane beta-barrel domain-containing protein [Campylobacterota bacterium]
MKNSKNIPIILLLILIIPSYLLAVLPRLNADDETIKKRKDGMLTLMAFTVLPDVTTSSLSITDAGGGNPGLQQTTLGGGFTLSEDFPLYLEGTAGYSRYDPQFIAKDANGSAVTIPVKWNSLSVTAGIGWDFPLTENKELKLRPIVNFTYGHIESDASILGRVLKNRFDLSDDALQFLENGRMDVYGLGGSLMLDWERYRDDYEIDVELRYTNIQLRSFNNDYNTVAGASEANNISLWSRWRAPTGMTLLNRPVRYVLEASNTTFLGAQRNAIGFNSLSTLGVGFELDSSAYPVFITRTRLLFRYTFGDNVSGYSIGLAMSF